MRDKVDQVSLSINGLAFYWSFPEIVAVEEGHYRDEGVRVVVRDFIPRTKIASKSMMYRNMQRRGLSDVYHAAEWVSISRVVEGENGRIVAWSPWLKDALNDSFGLYARSDSGFKGPADLENMLLAVEKGTGSYYTTIEDLENYFPRDRIRLKMLGDPHARLLAIINDKVAAGSLLGVYTDLAEHLGLVKIMGSSRRKGTLMVAKSDIDTNTLKKFIRGTNRAIRSINGNQDTHRPRYFARFERILNELNEKTLMSGKEIEHTIRVPRWAEWQEYPEESFYESYRWMVDREMVKGGYSYEDLVDLRAFRG